MRYAKKTKGNEIHAYELGAGSDMEKKLLEEGMIRLEEDGAYRLFSQEAVNDIGERAEKGDFFKVDIKDGKSYPYPNQRDWFLKNHVHLEGDTYEQIPFPVPFWRKDDPPFDAVEYLLDNNLLWLNEDDDTYYFNAVLWGTLLSAPRDAVLVFHKLERNEDGTIRSVRFNFVDRRIFEQNYTICENDADAEMH